MEFDSPDSPEVAKEFPGLYRTDGLADALTDPSAEYDDDVDKKKKKDKKDSKKDKGYAALAGESSHDEDDPAADPKSPGKKNIIKSFKLSGKKKDKEKEKDKEKDGKKPDKDKKSDKEKVKKFADLVGRKSADKEMVTPMRIPFSAERHRSSVPAAFMPSAMTTPKTSIKSEAGESSSEKSSMSALNAFLNAPAPLFLPKKKDKDKEKEHKKEKEGKEGKKDKEPKKDKENKKDKDKKEPKEKKEHSSSVSKVKLKLMRSKNSLEDPHELHVSVSHQFPEDPEALAKEIRKYEHLLEETHKQIKSSKKVSKKQEEQLWELQRTLTQLKRKLRSINALSSASANFSLHHHHQQNAHSSSSTHETRDSVPPTHLVSNTIPPPNSSIIEDTTLQKSESNEAPVRVANEELQLDFTLKSPDCADGTAIVPSPAVQTPSQSPTLPTTVKLPDNEDSDIVEHLSNMSVSSVPIEVSEERSEIPKGIRVLTEKLPVRRSLDFSEVEDDENFVEESKIDKNEISRLPEATNSLSRKGSKDATLCDLGVQPFRTESPLEREKVEVRVLVHNESREDSSSGSEDDPDETDIPAISPRQEENIGTVVNDANAMIGSMHEEMEELAAALVFRQRKFSEDGKGHVTLIKRQDGTDQQLITKISKSEPTFGDQANDSSDIELIREEEDDMDDFNEDIIPELMCLPIFKTEEYLMYENQELVIFNKKLQEDIAKEESFFDELEELKKSEGFVADVNESVHESDEESNDMEYWISVWQAEKSENEALHDNVSRLQQMVAIARLEEFKLETRLRYLEDKVLPISPITITTPLQANEEE